MRTAIDSSHLSRTLASFGAGMAVGGATIALLHRLLYLGYAQTFDTLLYARALWGVAHLDLHNPAAGVHAFSVHAHWGLVVLAPLARVADAATVLLLAQGVSAGLTAALVGLAAGAVAARAGLGRGSALVAVAAALLGTIASPLVANP